MLQIKSQGLGQQGLGQQIIYNKPGSPLIADGSSNNCEQRPQLYSDSWSYGRRSYYCIGHTPPTLFKAASSVNVPISCCGGCPPCPEGMKAAASPDPRVVCVCEPYTAPNCPAGYIPNSPFARESCNNAFVTSGNCIKCVPKPPGLARMPSAPPTFTGPPVMREMSELNQAAVSKSHGAVGGLGQAGAGCPSPLWYVVGGAVGWAVLGDVVKSLLGLGSKAAVHGISKVEKRIPARERGKTKYEVRTYRHDGERQQRVQTLSADSLVQARALARKFDNATVARSRNGEIVGIEQWAKGKNVGGWTD